MQLTLISSNIRFNNPADGPNDWDHRRSLLASTLLKHSPDIIATQEGRYDQLKDFESLMADYELIDQHRSWIKERMYPTLFLKKDKFEFLKSEDLWLSETPNVAGSKSFDSAFPRLMTWVSIQPKNSHKKLLLVNAHLDHIKRETREEQMKVLCHEVKRILPGHHALAIMGDFNDAPLSSVQEVMKKEFPDIQDAWAMFNTQEETSHHAFKGVMEDGARIDWIMLQGDLKIIDCRLDKTCDGVCWPSDHFPVVCQVNF